MDIEGGEDDLKREMWHAAMQYLQMGWSIIPIRMGDKKPAIEWKRFQEVAATEDEITSWFEDGVPDGNGGLTTYFNLAVITGEVSGLVVVDCDNQDALTYAVNEAGLFSLLTVSTTRGSHMYFKHPKGERVQCKAGGVGRDWPNVAGLDLRGDGGYVVAPPSVKLDADGNFKHQYRFSCPSEEVENFVSTIPLWPGMNIRPPQGPVTNEPFSFSKLNLSGVRSYGANVWSDMKANVEEMGRKMRNGDGRNPWMVRYVGECLATGMTPEEASDAAVAFQNEFYDDRLSDSEFQRVVSSIINSDKRNHPEKYAVQEEAEAAEEKKSKSSSLRLITSTNLPEVRKLSAGKEFVINPFVPPEAIIQVVGFNGHGKSLWLLNLLWSASRGQSYGSAHVTRKVRCLYLDFESSATTLSERIAMAEESIGPMSEEMLFWSASITGDDMPLVEEGNMNNLIELVNESRAQVVVIDTVRQAWSGMEENSPHSWKKVNDLAMHLRSGGLSVILVHHRNKPNMHGHGREAGSTAQLKDLDVQIIVTKVVQDSAQVVREAAIDDSKTSVKDHFGNTCTAWEYLKRKLPDGQSLRFVFEISFGKLRQATDNHVVTYVGMAEDNETGKQYHVSTLTPLQKATILRERGESVQTISTSLNVSKPTIRNWLNLSKEEN